MSKELYTITCVDCGEPFTSSDPKNSVCDTCFHLDDFAEWDEKFDEVPDEPEDYEGGN